MEKVVSSVLEENLQQMKLLFGADATLKIHRFQPMAVSGIRCAICFLDGLVDSIRINESIIQPVSTLVQGPAKGISLIDFLQTQVLQVNEIQKETRMDKLLHAMLYGDTLLFAEGCACGLILGSKGFAKRGISEPAGETYLKGPREGFLEPLMLNLAMLRRRLRTPDLRMEFFILGESTKTDCCLCYLLPQVDRVALSQLKKRLSSIVIDGVLDSNYVSELIRDQRFSPFRTTGSTERPDVVETGVEIPTKVTEERSKNYTVGVYEGGGYRSKGIYRPVDVCRMRNNTAERFCPVCERSLERVIMHQTTEK